MIPDFSQSHNFDEIIAVAIEAEFHVSTTDFDPVRCSRGFNVEEQTRMDELFVASRALVEPLDLKSVSLKMLIGSTNLIVVNFRRLSQIISSV